MFAQVPGGGWRPSGVVGGPAAVLLVDGSAGVVVEAPATAFATAVAIVAIARSSASALSWASACVTDAVTCTHVIV